jgi:excisionase family DNA binding protein
MPEANNNAGSKRLLRLKPAAAYLSISTAYLRRLIQRGELDVIRMDDGGHAPWLVDVRDLDEWVERTKTRF